ncbi:MAG TPA: bifunctional UDP-N-acetylmuramoyl-tripeptide:D-alanyl-D-alanine ligase/alanine racemase, partial [Marinilabiliaceae bacterium]|nr:bifunctional UDP-N-acetylmuramoyl-tripeptide:D-alanyl-D-alanine ligase/alanine racemase [Marinilabiliaceae bacterium]
GELHAGPEESEITRLSFDSRLVFDPKGVLFFAFQSGQNDGHDYIPELYQKGVRMFVVRNSFEPAAHMNLASWLRVSDPLKSLQQIAAFHRKKFNTEVLAITGSNGKTIVKEWLAQLFNNDFPLVRSPRSYNSQIGVPLSVWEMNSTHRLAIFEAGISHPGEMIRLKEIIQPTVGIITNIGTAHKENFTSSASILKEKLKLFEDVEILLYNRDSNIIHQAVNTLWSEKKFITWGRGTNSDLQLLSIEEGELTKLSFQWEESQFELELPFGDLVSIENTIPVVLFALYKGYSPDIIAQRVLNLEQVAMRMERKAGLNNCLIINDSYNSDFTSLEVALDFLDQQAKKKGMERTLILSDLLQTGYKDEEIYPRVAKLISTKNITRLIGVGPKMFKYSSFFRNSDRFFISTEELLSAISSFSFRDEAILIKGARSFAFERVSDLLEQKQHSTIMEVNLNAFVNNLNVYKQYLKPTTKVLAMVKAFGYGSGSYEIAAALQHQKVDYLGVAFADEGMELRRNGITLPIIVMNPEIKSFGQMLEFGLEPEIYSLHTLKAFDRVARDYGATQTNIHLKLDTGMNRFGFSLFEGGELFQLLKQKPHLKVCSLFSHLVGSDEEKHDNFTNQQVEIFEDFSKKLEAQLGYSFIRHILNSAGIERFPQFQFDMVRVGIGLYGFSSVNDSRMQNVLSLKSYVSQIKNIHEKSTVGYGRKGVLNGGDSLAVIPVGYADGLSRQLSNGVGEVRIGKQLFPIVGNVCMDTCMVNVTGGNVKEGDEVIIFGDDFSLSLMAEKLNTIPYEIMTSISQRVKRIYFRE